MQQIFHAREIELKKSWDEITTLAKSDREWLTKNLPFDSLTIKKTTTSSDNSAIKWLLNTTDNDQIETVLLIHTGQKKNWGTICISSQIGCPVGCLFCATGQMGFKRNLTTEEILDQFLIAKRETHRRSITDLNIVFMGMGEPLLNIENVLSAIEIFTNPKHYALSPTRITISTSGIIPGLKKLFNANLKISLALSLHAPTEELREKIMPINKIYPLTEILAELKKWEQRGAEILYEYVLIDQVNDSLADAKKLAELLQGRKAKINLIPLNPIENSSFKKPSNNRLHAFLDTLKKAGINNVTFRHTKGDEIQAACGQLKS